MRISISMLIATLLVGCVTVPFGTPAMNKPTRGKVTYVETPMPEGAKIEYTFDIKAAAGVDLSRVLRFRRQDNEYIEISGEAETDSSMQAESITTIAGLQAQILAEIIPSTVEAAKQLAIKQLEQVPVEEGVDKEAMILEWLTNNADSILK